MAQKRELDPNIDATFREISEKLGENEATLHSRNETALKKAREFLALKGYKKSDFFGEDK